MYTKQEDFKPILTHYVYCVSEKCISKYCIKIRSVKLNGLEYTYVWERK